MSLRLIGKYWKEDKMRELYPKSEVFKKSWLPNVVGYKFIAIKKDDSEQICVVQKHLDGTHYVRGIKYEDFTCWRRLSMTGKSEVRRSSC